MQTVAINEEAFYIPLLDSLEQLLNEPSVMEQVLKTVMQPTFNDLIFLRFLLAINEFFYSQYNDMCGVHMFPLCNNSFCIARRTQKTWILNYVIPY